MKESNNTFHPLKHPDPVSVVVQDFVEVKKEMEDRESDPALQHRDARPRKAVGSTLVQGKCKFLLGLSLGQQWL